MLSSGEGFAAAGSLRLAALAAAALLLAPPPPLGAQVPAPGEELSAVAERVAGLWSSAGLDRVAGLLDSGGVRVQVPGGDRGTLEPRKARAVLRELLEGHDGGRVEVARTSAGNGTPARGFAELRWSTVPRGTSEVIRYTLFLGLVHGPEGWRLYEIRVLR